MLTVSQGKNALDDGARALFSSSLVLSLSTDKIGPESCMFTASFFILALHALVGQFIHSVHRERCGDGPRDIEARDGARVGEARCGPRDSGARGGIRDGGAQGFQDGEA